MTPAWVWVIVWVIVITVSVLTVLWLVMLAFVSKFTGSTMREVISGRRSRQ